MVEAETIADAVYAALARQLRKTPADIRSCAQQPLEQLGLDSHGLLRVLLEVERALSLASSLELGDDALATPASLAEGVVAVVGRGAG